jgi:hypothetical protein
MEFGNWVLRLEHAPTAHHSDIDGFSLLLPVLCSEHNHAVACLRQLNNNPTAFTNERRPIIEFAIDNVKVRGT